MKAIESFDWFADVISPPANNYFRVLPLLSGVTQTGVTVASQGRRSGRAAYFPDTSYALSWGNVLGGTIPPWHVMGVAIRFAGGWPGAGVSLLRFGQYDLDNGSQPDEHMELRTYGSSGLEVAYRSDVGGASTVLGHIDGVLSTSTSVWNYIEYAQETGVALMGGGYGGGFSVRVNQATVLSSALSQGLQEVRYHVLGPWGGGGTAIGIYADDWYVNEVDYPATTLFSGDVAVECMRVTGARTIDVGVGLTVNGGANPQACIQDTLADNATTYLSTTNAINAERYPMGPAPTLPTGAQILCIAPAGVAYAESFSTAAQFDVYWYVQSTLGSLTGDGALRCDNTLWLQSSLPVDTNPVQGRGWLAADLTGIQAGLHNVANGAHANSTMRVTQFLLQVAYAVPPAGAHSYGTVIG